MGLPQHETFQAEPFDPVEAAFTADRIQTTAQYDLLRNFKAFYRYVRNPGVVNDTLQEVGREDLLLTDSIEQVVIETPDEIIEQQPEFVEKLAVARSGIGPQELEKYALLPRLRYIDQMRRLSSSDVYGELPRNLLVIKPAFIRFMIAVPHLACQLVTDISSIEGPIQHHRVKYQAFMAYHLMAPLVDRTDLNAVWSDGSDNNRHLLT